MIDEGPYPYEILGIFKSFQEAVDFNEEKIIEDVESETRIISWDIINNKLVHPNDFDGGGSPLAAGLARAA